MDPPTPISPNLTGASLARAAYNASKAKLEQILAATDINITNLEKSSSDWRKIESAADDIHKKLPKIIKFDVGGTIFATSPQTILSRFPLSLLGAIISTNVWVPSDGVYFFDRSPRLFSVVLDYIREGVLDVVTLDSTDDIKALIVELDFFCVPYKLNEENVPTTKQEAFPVISTLVNSFVQNASATVSEAKEVFTAINSFIEIERIESVSRTKQRQELIDVINVLSKEAKDKVAVNYGGQHFTTTAANLSKCDYFEAQLTRWRVQGDSAPIFVDRNPTFFGLVLEYLRTGHWRPSEVPSKLKPKLWRELDYLSFRLMAPPFVESKVLDETLLGKLEEWLPGNALSLLYRASRDNWGTNMHSRLEGEGPLLFVARSDKLVFGAYTSVSCCPSNQPVIDPNCFIFGFSSDKLVRTVITDKDQLPNIQRASSYYFFNIPPVFVIGPPRKHISKLNRLQVSADSKFSLEMPSDDPRAGFFANGRMEDLEVFAVVSLKP